MESDHEQNYLNQKSQHQLKQQYWQQWKDYVEEVRKQRYRAVKMLEYQNLLEQRLLHKTFKAWLWIHQQEKFQQLLRLKNSLIQQEQHDYSPDLNQQKSQTNQQNEETQKMTRAIKFYQRKTYAKCIRAWICYRIHCKRFQDNLSRTFIKHLLRKYFDIINEFRLRSKEKKAKKAQTSIQISPMKEDLNITVQSQLNFLTPANLISQIDRFPMTSQNFRQALHENPIFKRTQAPQPQSSTFYQGFQRNPGLMESRRSQFSTLSAQLDYNSKRKFRPITELPSIPDLENISKRLSENRTVQLDKSPIKSYQDQKEQQKSLYNQDSVSNLSQSKFSQAAKQEQDPVKSRILELLVKQKLLTLAIMSGDEFEQQGLEYENYRQKTINSLRKLKDIKIK